MNREARILEPGQMEAPASAIRPLFLPGRDLFGRRAERLRRLSEGHPLENYLVFLSLLADAQQEALNRFPGVALPHPRELALCREHGMPLLSAHSLPRNPAWQEGLTMILRTMEEIALPTAARETVSGLIRATGAELEEMAGKTLTGDLAALPPQVLPFVAAALQVYWVHMASALEEQAVDRLAETGVCPVCGSYPIAGIVHSGGAGQGLRYLCCSLCASQWYMVRVTCSCCASTHGISYYTVEGSNGAVKAESCGDCGSYLKLMYLEKDGRMEAMADDVATLALDMLMDREGKLRGGLNLFFHPGEV